MRFQQKPHTILNFVDVSKSIVRAKGGRRENLKLYHEKLLYLLTSEIYDQSTKVFLGVCNKSVVYWQWVLYHSVQSMSMIPLLNFLFTDDRFRAILRTSTNGNEDYINAVVVAVFLVYPIHILLPDKWMAVKSISSFVLLIQGYTEAEYYILTQSPLKETVADLWKLVSDYNSSTIVMLNQISTAQVPYFNDFTALGISLYFPCVMDVLFQF